MSIDVKHTDKRPIAVRWNLLNVDSSIQRDTDQLLLRWDLYGKADPRITLLKELIARILNMPFINNQLKTELNKVLTPLKIYKVY
jgi:hypothetical protein